MSNKHVMKRARFVYEVLYPADDDRIDDMDIPDVVSFCLNGEWSGRTLGHTTTLLDHKQAKLACEGHGTEIACFCLPEFAVGTRVYWTDPDDGLCSGYGTIVDYHGDTYDLKMEGSGDTEASGHELSLKKPKKGKK